MSRRSYVETWVDAVWKAPTRRHRSIPDRGQKRTATGELTPTEKLVAFAHARVADFNTGGNCYPGENRITAETGLSRSMVLRSRSQLEVEGWLEAKRRGGSPKGGKRSATFYQLTFPTGVTTTRVTGVRTTPVPVSGERPTSVTTTPHHQQTRTPPPSGTSDGVPESPETCTTCDGNRRVLDDDNVAHPCPDCTRSRSVA